MRETNIEITCRFCNKPFRLFSDDTDGDTTICWNYCPHCGNRNDVWLRFLTVQEAKAIPVGIGCMDAHKKFATSKKKAKP